MKALLPRLRLLALLVAFLPGLLLSEGEHLRFCLHALTSVDDACMAVEDAEALPSCCTQVPQGPSVTSQERCGDCCVEIAGHSREQVAPAPSAAASVVTGLALPPGPAHVFSARQLETAPWIPAPPAAASVQGRAPTPLRI